MKFWQAVLTALLTVTFLHGDRYEVLLERIGHDVICLVIAAVMWRVASAIYSEQTDDPR